MDRRGFIQATLASAGLAQTVEASELGKVEPKEVLLLTYPHGNYQAYQDCLTVANEICEQQQCGIVLMPDIMSLQRISKADAEEIIRHIVRISPTYGREPHEET